MIGRNEPIQRKAKFWQSYVRALKGNNYSDNKRTVNFSHSKFHSVGTDDIRAPEATHYSRYPSSRGIFRPILDTFPSWPASKSIYDDPIAACDRMSVPGYRYLPISRETYGLSPRNIYPHNYSSLSRAPRSADTDYATRIRGEFKHDNEGHFQYEYYQPPCTWDPTEGRQHDQAFLNPQDRRRGNRPFVKEYTVGPDGAKVPLYTYTGKPIYSRGGFSKRYIPDLYSPKNDIPMTRWEREHWWWAYPSPKPFEAPYIPMNHNPFFLRDSYLSPVKNTYLWRDHPIRPFTTTPRLNF
ncbi:hypothetical protein GE061_013042 [Apolygus lucorum]|uniref:Myofilin n=1 Tax=Apolygus lucorum TaxID=248454 RepID=A0A6A4JC02_APOLU|nr:hypothetical protein GE061_013042 [Apolygus lucorum]